MIGAPIAYAKRRAAKQPPVPLWPTLAGMAGVLIILHMVTQWIDGLPRRLRRGLVILGAVLGGTALLWIVGVAAGIHLTAARRPSLVAG